MKSNEDFINDIDTALHVKWNDLKHNLARGKAFNYPELVNKHQKTLQIVEGALFK